VRRLPTLLGRLTGSLLAALLMQTASAPLATAQFPSAHYFHSANLPPGTVGQGQLLRGGPLPGYFQPVEIRVPKGVLLALAENGHFGTTEEGSVTVGMQIGQVYRVKVANIPFYEGLEVYPSIEVINRLYPPPGQARRFPIPVQITAEELELALNGNFVTRVIYLEDKETALPQREDPERQSYFEVRSDQDPLEIADRLGKPMAILRMGSRIPDRDAVSGKFTFGMPPLLRFPALPETVSTPPAGSPVQREARHYPRLPLAPQAPGHSGMNTGAPWLR
jgi:hypothetical protein